MKTNVLSQGSTRPGVSCEKISALKEVRHLTTYACNLNCKHCYLTAGKNNAQKRPTKEFTQEELDKFYGRYKPAVVSATGGEPLLQLNLVKKIASSVAGYGGALELVTNGFLLKAEVLDDLFIRNPKLFVQISLDGIEETHDKIRDHAGAYKKAFAAIGMAMRKDLHVKIRLTAMNDNIGQIPEIIKRLDEFQEKNLTLVIRPVLYAGRAKKNGLKLDIDYKELDLFKNMARFIKVETTDNEGKCGCGINTVVIDPRGDIYPCTYFVFDEKKKMGNITDVGGNKFLDEQPEFKNFDGACYARQIRA